MGGSLKRTNMRRRLRNVCHAFPCFLRWALKNLDTSALRRTSRFPMGQVPNIRARLHSALHAERPRRLERSGRSHLGRERRSHAASWHRKTTPFTPSLFIKWGMLMSDCPAENNKRNDPPIAHLRSSLHSLAAGTRLAVSPHAWRSGA